MGMSGLVLGLGCAQAAPGDDAPGVNAPGVDAPGAPEEAAPVPLDGFESWLDAPLPVADGFARPVDATWKTCGDGCWQRDGLAPVQALADAEVVSVEAGTVVLGSLWYEDHERRALTTTIRGLASELVVGHRVERGEVLGVSQRVEVALEGTDEPVAAFIAARPTLFVPQDEPALAVISHDAYEMRIYTEAVETGRYAISFGQGKGEKQRRGDLRTPKGMYFVTVRSKGPFDGAVGQFYGGHWIKVNYPEAS